MNRSTNWTLTAAALLVLAPAAARGQAPAPDWHLVYTPSHRATFEQQWTYTFPEHHSSHWFIALRYPPELAWSRNAEGSAELLTSAGWKPFKEVGEAGGEKRHMLVIDSPHNDPKLQRGFTVRTTLTATICDQHLVKGKPARAVHLATPELREAYLAATETFDFHAPNVKKWMTAHHLWKDKAESPLDFARRVYRELRQYLPYDTKDGGPWVCSQILKVGFGECCRHAIVGTSILRANNIPARTVCSLWAIDNKSEGAHCWGEFFLPGVGWVPYDTTLGDDRKTDAYFAQKKGELIAGMVDFDWIIDAGSFGRQTVFGIDAFPGFWSKGKGSLDNPKVVSKTKVHVVKRFSTSLEPASQDVAVRAVKHGNPVFEGWYADPEAAIFGKEYWIYPTYSAPYDQQLFLDTFSSLDLVTWTKHPRILDASGVKWARRAIWAPAIVEKDGKYFLFFSANDIQEREKTVGGIGVAVADRPAGPFKDYLGKPLIGEYHHGAQPIDQFVFKDRDGQYYIIYGGHRHCNIARLNADFTGLLPLTPGSEERFKEITPRGYVEGPLLFWRNGRYYLMWSEGGWTGPNYAVAYGTSESLLGPYQRVRKVLSQDPAVATGAGHHSLFHLEKSDAWYIVYHRRPLGDRNPNHRVVCIDRMRFDAQGQIEPVVITHEGVEPRRLD